MTDNCPNINPVNYARVLNV